MSDVVEALVLAGENESVNGQVFNLGYPEPRSLLEFAQILKGLADFEIELVPFPAEAAVIDIGDYYGDFRKFHEATGWQPTVDLEEGLAETLRYFRADGRHLPG